MEYNFDLGKPARKKTVKLMTFVKKGGWSQNFIIILLLGGGKNYV